MAKQDIEDLRNEVEMLHDALSMPVSKLPLTFLSDAPRRLLLEDAIAMLMRHVGMKIEYVPSSRGKWIVTEDKGNG